MGVNFFTGRASYVRPRQGDLELALGSGFFVRFDELPVFVTARHNLTGRHWTNNNALHDTGRCPQNISIHVPIVETVPHGGRFGFKETIIELEQNYAQVWNEISVAQGVCDVGCIVLDPSWEREFISRWQAEHKTEGSFKVGCINDGVNWHDIVDREHAIGSPAFAVGYPLGLTASGPNRPIWRGGFVATEPRANFEDWPTFLIDIAGRKGLSGAPVLVKDTSGSLSFAGVYSGRVLPEEHNSDLGYVWKCSVINELIRTTIQSGNPTR